MTTSSRPRAGDRYRIPSGWRENPNTKRPEPLIVEVDRVEYGTVTYHALDNPRRQYTAPVSDIEYRLSIAGPYRWERIDR